MKTTCYCIYCSKHPLNSVRKGLKCLTGWDVGDFIDSEYEDQGKKVSCLKPMSNAFDELNIDPADWKFPVTAYRDGISITGFEGRGFEISANCENEDYIEVD